MTHASAAQQVRAFIDFPPDASTGQRLRASFESPVALLRAWLPEQVAPLLAQLEQHAAQGRWCLGALAYEAASAFDTKLSSHSPRVGWPLAEFAVFDKALPWPLSEAESASNEANPDWRFSMGEADYASKVERARQAMAAGDCYQINLTGQLEASFTGDLAAWMARLQAAQPDSYALWLDWGDRQFLSASPELFFHWQPSQNKADKASGQLSCKPMKGTAPRHADPQLDAAAKQTLADNAKERAENVMIVDLLRSDMGRIAVAGSVQVDQLFEVQALPTVWQMTSTISARTQPGTGLVEIFSALFPCGSITGAPKASAMQWITQLETGARGIYCGAAGVLQPGGAATFNVPIRSLMLERLSTATVSPSPSPSPSPSTSVTDQAWQAVYGVGSGITFYANPKDEWQELAHKSRLLERSVQTFELLETLRLQDGQYWLLDLHLARMAQSAVYFGFVWDRAKVQTALQAIAQHHAQGNWRVRLCSTRTGVVSVAAFALEDSPEPVRFKLSQQPLDTRSSKAEFVLHKTTRRQHYDERLLPGSFDTLLCNQRGELSEFTRGNLALCINGQWLTPSLESGLLPGTFRAWLLASGRLKEAVLTPADLQAASSIAFFNSVRGWLTAQVK